MPWPDEYTPRYLTISHMILFGDIIALFVPTGCVTSPGVGKTLLKLFNVLLGGQPQ